MDGGSSHVLEQPLDIFTIHVGGIVSVRGAAVATRVALVLLWWGPRGEGGAHAW